MKNKRLLFILVVALALSATACWKVIGIEDSFTATGVDSPLGNPLFYAIIIFAVFLHTIIFIILGSTFNKKIENLTGFISLTLLGSVIQLVISIGLSFTIAATAGIWLWTKIMNLGSWAGIVVGILIFSTTLFTILLASKKQVKDINLKYSIMGPMFLYMNYRQISLIWFLVIPSLAALILAIPLLLVFNANNDPQETNNNPPSVEL